MEEFDVNRSRGLAQSASALALRRPPTTGAVGWIRRSGLPHRLEGLAPHKRARSSSWSIYNIPKSQRTPDAFQSLAPVEVFDPQGRLWFVEYAQPLLDGNELRARVAGWKTFDRQVMSVEIGPPRKLPKLMSKAATLAVRLGLRAADEEPRVVCYAYPRLGLPFLTREGQRVFIDLTDQSLHLVRPKEIPTSAQKVERAEVYEAVLGDRDAPAGSAALSGIDSIPSRASLEAMLGPDGIAGVTVDEKDLGIEVLEQEEPSWCAPACACMVFNYFRLQELDQGSVAAKMDPTNRAQFGIRPTDQAAGLNRIFDEQGKALRAVLTFPEYDWDNLNYRNLSFDNDIKARLDAKMPLLWIQSAHVVVISGYLILTPPNQSTVALVWACDPRGAKSLYTWTAIDDRAMIRGVIHIEEIPTS